MKVYQSLFLFIAFCVISTLSTRSQTSDYAMVEKCISDYLTGDTQKDFDTLKASFHPAATMKYVSSTSGYKEYNALEVFAGDKGREPEKNRIDTISYISITGKAAHAKVEVNYPNLTVVDYLNLLKIDGKWLIVNKIFSRKTSFK